MKRKTAKRGARVNVEYQIARLCRPIELWGDAGKTYSQAVKIWREAYANAGSRQNFGIVKIVTTQLKTPRSTR